MGMISGPTIDRKGLMQPKRTEKNFGHRKVLLLVILCHLDIFLSYFNSIMTSISVCNMAIAYKEVVNDSRLSPAKVHWRQPAVSSKLSQVTADC